ncbi:RacP protein [Streptomyces rhizosphaericus]|uniref:RacP protein n=1 Tax=Streptomyces rhizosphaericus TaxID=114699 RepID=A0A6G4AS85_9ACTN|nr:RacP protein [Streptomyces rhizosphaericus]NEW75327.1 RacP protein [Streptomyces rhizosphaericus]
MPRRSRRQGDAARAHAEAIQRVLMEARPAGLHTPQLVRATELTVSQVRSGLAMLRDIIARRGWAPLVYTRADGYQFTADENQLQAYEIAVIHEKLTEIRRLITGTVTPHAALAPDDKWVRHIVAQLNSVESTLNLIA